MITIQNQKFGVEYEFTGITRHQAAKVLQSYFGSEIVHSGGYYDKYYVLDRQGRKWTVMSDASIRTFNRQGERSDKRYSCELVTPICNYEDIENIQNIVRCLKQAGSKVNSSCGIHIHIDGSNHTARSIRNLSLIIASKEAPMITALQVHDSRQGYCQPTDIGFARQLDDARNPTLEQIEDWYYNGNQERQRHHHYSAYRYHMLNLHAYFGERDGTTHNTVEFRCFNSTQHAGRVKAYIQFCLAVSQQAINQKTAHYRPMDRQNDAYVFRTWLNRAGLIGDEFKTCRKHMLAHLQGDLVYRDRANVRHRRERYAQELSERVRTATAQTDNPNNVSISELPVIPSERPDVPSFSLAEQVDTFIRSMQLDGNLTVADRAQIIEILSSAMNSNQRAEVQRTVYANDMHPQQDQQASLSTASNRRG